MDHSETLENQPQGADGSEEVMSDLDNFIGSSDSDESEPETESPEPADAEEADAESSEEDESSEEEEQGEEESESEEEQADPFEEIIGRLTLKEREKYATRYPNAWKRANSPDATDDDRQLLIDKINTDLEYQQLRSELEAEEEPTQEAEEESEATPEPEVDPAKQLENYNKFVDSIVQQFVNPEAAKELGMNLLQAFMPDVDLAKTIDPEVKALIANAPKLGSVLSRGAVDLVASVMPALLARMQEQVFPGFNDMYTRSMYALTWDQVRSADPKFAELPNYGTKEYRQLMKKASAEIPNFQNWEFRDAKGRALPEAKQAELKLKYLAKIATGQQQPKVTPKVVEKALDKGKELARKSEQRRKAGKALGAGQSTRQALGSKQRDYILDDLDNEIQKQGAGARGVRK